MSLFSPLALTVPKADPERLAQALDVFAAEAGEAAPRVTERGRLVVFERID